MSMTQVYQWCSWFKDGRTSLHDEPRSGRPDTANNDWNTARVDELIKVDRRVKLKEISLKLDIPKTNFFKIVHDKLGYRKVSARWVPKMLSDEHKRQRVEISQIPLHRCQQEGDETVDVGPGQGTIVPGTSFLNTLSLEMKLGYTSALRRQNATQ
ncbi:histone-lysine N-methyltransferase SETMAR [Plakobranchus ocellatus]|uniref:Histone-lysine N-methyltransferase SETMAR n=1 Tax=Plakobranchus ocellatus TaxID=259542 RepID=A0AAV3Z503_9GAST|nr:histone-lysine N-methyltransferase SETMAR [Plakobranchus ocellatus]